MLQTTLGPENSPNLWKKYEPVSRFVINSYYMLQSTLGLENSPNLWQKYEPVSRFLTDLTSITYCSQL